jgi:hypothetical protein
MRLHKFIIILLIAWLSITCRQETKREPERIEYKEMTVVDVVDDIPPPPEDLASKFKTLQEWLYSICDNRNPKKSITNFNFGLFESPGNNIIYLASINKYNKGDTFCTRIEVESRNMYFKLPSTEYKNLNRDQLLNKLTDQLKTFANTDKLCTVLLTGVKLISPASESSRIFTFHLSVPHCPKAVSYKISPSKAIRLFRKIFFMMTVLVCLIKVGSFSKNYNNLSAEKCAPFRYPLCKNRAQSYMEKLELASAWSLRVCKSDYYKFSLDSNGKFVCTGDRFKSIELYTIILRTFSTENSKFSKSQKTANLGNQPYPTLPFE